MQTFPSSQSLSMLQQSAMSVFSQPPGSMQASAVQRLRSSQSGAVPAPQEPAEQVSVPLQRSESGQFVPSATKPSIGQAASMGSVIASQGTKGKRFCLRNSRNLMHQPLISGVMEGQATDIEIEAKEMIRLRDRLYTLYSDQTGQSKERIEADCDRNKWLDDQEMIEYGLIDAILEDMPKTQHVATD